MKATGLSGITFTFKPEKVSYIIEADTHRIIAYTSGRLVRVIDKKKTLDKYLVIRRFEQGTFGNSSSLQAS